jgi:HK97 gp10 family phage protein
MGFQSMGFDDFAKELEELGNIDKYAPEMLKAAAPILEKELKGQVKKEANRGYATGDLERSIKAQKPGKNEYGHYVVISADGKDRKGVRNNEKLAYLNYGTSKQQARPVISKAVQNSENDCLDAMQEKYNEVTGE